MQRIMTEYRYFPITRRRSCQLLGAAALSAITTSKAWSAPIQIRIVTDKGVENQTMIELMSSQGYLASFGVKQSLLMVEKPPATLKALIEDKADLCVTSAFNGVLPAITKGAPIKIVGSAMQKLALAVYSCRQEITSASDLAGRAVGIGPKWGLLHVVALALLQAKGVDPAKVRFVNLDSNLDVYRHVKAGKVDAGLSDVSDIADAKASGLHILTDGELWKELPDYPYQFAYASDRAIRENREGIVRALAAYGKLFRFVSSPPSWSAYAAARAAAGGNKESAQAVWHYIQMTHTYAGSPETSGKHIDYLQGLDVSFGLQPSVLPLNSVADLSLARDATNMI
jgi:ABC-type nitrate/sulfonate/bicarbonate transport system substrate-binding protein